MKAGWKTVNLGEVCSFERGLTYSKSDEADAPGITVLRANNVDLTSGQLNLDDLRYISAKVAVHEKKYLSANSIIVCTASGSRDHLGKTAHISEPPRMTFGGFMGLLRPSPEIDSRFLFHLTRSDLYRSLISGLSSGTNINNLKGSDLLSWEIPLPPLAEQKRIVALLDAAFAGIDEAMAKAEACLAGSKSLIDCHLRAVFCEQTNRWEKSTIGAEMRFIDYRGKTPAKTASGIRLITAKNVKMGHLQDTPMEFIATKDYDKWMTRGIPRKGDVLFTTEAPLANVAQLDTDEKVAFAQRIIILQPNANRLNSSFLKYLLISQPVQERIRAKGTGATVQGIKASLLKLIEISFPQKLTTQEEVVAKMDTLLVQARNLTKVHVQRIEALNELKKSILTQAFAGELTA